MKENPYEALTRVLTFLFVTLAVIALVGCGVSKEDHEKTVSELSKTKADLAQAKTKIGELEKSLTEAQLSSKANQRTSPQRSPPRPERSDRSRAAEAQALVDEARIT